MADDFDSATASLGGPGGWGGHGGGDSGLKRMGSYDERLQDMRRHLRQQQEKQKRSELRRKSREKEMAQKWVEFQTEAQNKREKELHDRLDPLLQQRKVIVAAEVRRKTIAEATARHHEQIAASASPVASQSGGGTGGVGNSLHLKMDAAQRASISEAIKPCPGGCGFQVTWHETHCCGACSRDSEHGPRCDMKPMPANVVGRQSVSANILKLDEMRRGSRGASPTPRTATQAPDSGTPAPLGAAGAAIVNQEAAAKKGGTGSINMLPWAKKKKAEEVVAPLRTGGVQREKSIMQQAQEQFQGLCRSPDGRAILELGTRQQRSHREALVKGDPLAVEKAEQEAEENGRGEEEQEVEVQELPSTTHKNMNRKYRLRMMHHITSQVLQCRKKMTGTMQSFHSSGLGFSPQASMTTLQDLSTSTMR